MRPADLGVPRHRGIRLQYGLRRLPPEAAAPRLAALDQLMQPMVAPFDTECAAEAARIRAELEAAGTPSARTTPDRRNGNALSGDARHAERAGVFAGGGVAVGDAATDGCARHSARTALCRFSVAPGDQQSKFV